MWLFDINQLLVELKIMDFTNSKPNYTELGNKYNLDPRTVKKYHEGYKGKPKNRDKPSKLDKHKDEIVEKLSIPRTTKKGVYKNLVKKYGYDNIGTYSNFKTYCKKRNLKPKKDNTITPRFETNYGELVEVDFKENIKLTSKSGEVFIVNVLHVCLKFSRYSYVELTASKEQAAVIRCMINAFKFFGGVPLRCLFDNMSSIVHTNIKPKRVSERFKQFAKDFNFEIQLCGFRKARTKGTNESRNKILDWIRPYDKEFETYEDLIKIVEDINKDMNLEICQGTKMPPYVLFLKEKEYLSPIANKDIVDSYIAPTKVHVESSLLVDYKGIKYSVDCSLIDKYVQLEEFNGKLYIYYNGKLMHCHNISKNPINYTKEHYRDALSNSIKEEHIDEVVKKNLEIMDKLMEKRKMIVNLKEASSSKEKLTVYLLQKYKYSEYMTNFISSLKAEDEKIFFEETLKLMPYIVNEKLFIETFKSVIKKKDFKNIRLYVYIDSLSNPNNPILSVEGNKIIYEEFKEVIDSKTNEINESKRNQ